MNKFDLSVIVPVHNLEPYLQMLLDSFKRQITDYKIEYIFVLDTCSDGSRGRIMMADLPNTHIIECSVRACGIARNVGYAAAKGDYIWFIDGDDWLLGSKVFSSVLNAFKETKANVIKIDWATTPIWTPAPVEGDKVIDPMVWQFIYSKAFLDKYHLKFTDIQPGEDAVFTTEVLNSLRTEDGKFVSMTGPMYFYNFGRSGSNMNQQLTEGKIVIN